MMFFLLKGFFFLYALMQVVLSKFVRQMGDLLPSTLYISYLRMLKGLANGPQCAHYCFSLLKTNGATHSKSTPCTLFQTIRPSDSQSLSLQLKIFKCTPTNVMYADAGDNIQGVSGSPVSWEHFFHSLMLYHENLRRDFPNPDTAQYRHPPLRGITQRELEGLTSFLQLLTTIITWVCYNNVWLH